MFERSALVCALGVLLHARAWACSCAYSSPREAYEDATYAFTGTVHHSGGGCAGTSRLTLVADRIYKVPDGESDPIVLRVSVGNDSCAFSTPPEEGSRWLFLSEDDRVSGCTSMERLGDGTTSFLWGEMPGDADDEWVPWTEEALLEAVEEAARDAGDIE